MYIYIYIYIYIKLTIETLEQDVKYDANGICNFEQVNAGWVGVLIFLFANTRFDK